MSEEEIIQTLENMIKSWNNIREDCKNSDLSKQIEQIEKENKAIQGLLDLYNKQKEEIEQLKLITKEYDSYIGEKMPLNSKIIIADREYFMNGIFVNSYVSKYKIREVLEQERIKQKERNDISLKLHSQYISLIDKIKKQLLEE